MIRVALCGVGYWGANLFRVLAADSGLVLTAVADHDVNKLNELHASHPHIRCHGDAAQMIADSDIDAVVIATPVAFHYDLARAALDGGKHVLIEKPMCTSVAEAADLVARADAAELTLMVDHTFLFHPAVCKLQQLIFSGALGHVSYYDSQRINLGLFQPDVNVLWDLAPHDLSILDFLFGQEPVHIEASGYCHVNPVLPDICYLTLHYPNRMVAHLNLSWMSPVKVRRVAVGGSNQMAVWDDLNRDEPLKIYDSGINLLSGSERPLILPSYRLGSVSSPRLPNTEPLTLVVEHFRRTIIGQDRSIPDGCQGLRVVRTLERAQIALNLSLHRVRSATPNLIGAVAAE